MPLAVIRALLMLVLAALAGCPEGDAPAVDEVAADSAPAEVATGADEQDAVVTPTAAETVDAEAPPAKVDVAVDAARLTSLKAADTGEAEAVIDPPPPSPDDIFRAGCASVGKGQATRTGSGELVCVRAAKDAGKRCKASTDCRDSLCLARSGTCAPITPLYGCYDILSATGARQSYCRE